MRVQIAALIVCLAGPFGMPTATGQGPAPLTCPTCFASTLFQPLVGHGPAPDGSGRRVINICFNTSAQVDNYGNPTPGATNSVFWNGLNGSSGAIST